ncbi:MAG: 3-demethylubiquinone-9 3-O-methyltransferase [Bdellovibrionales bacterium]|nr:3-demethylubiquinone-9 3-O-methyltransferase [Bdellovibrionales bacterium]
MESQINTAVYSELGERWYKADDDPIALLRAESRFRNPWVLQRVKEISEAPAVLDLGCGAGFLSNFLAENACKVVGVDQSAEALQVAERYDSTGKVLYHKGDLLEYQSREGFDAVTAMDILEHVERPELLVEKAFQCLRPDGVFVFYTFNRNLLSYILAIKAVEVFVSNVPENLHLYDLFIKPGEMRHYLRNSGFENLEFFGVQPKLNFQNMKHIALTGSVPKDFEFQFCRRHLVAYMGVAVKPHD